MRPRPTGPSGFALVEILVALVLGLAVVGAALSTYLSTGQSSRVQSASAQMNEDAQIALRILAGELMMAGYAQPVDFQDAPSLRFTKNVVVALAVKGCQFGFASNDSANCKTSLSASGVNTAAGRVLTPSAIELSYQADGDNALRTQDGRLADCRGFGLPVGNSVVSPRYFVDVIDGRTALRCMSQQEAVALVENVEEVRFWFGVGNANGSREVVRYVPASSVPDFQQVVSVRVCLVVKSAEPVISQEALTEQDGLNGGQGVNLASYLDCDLTSQTSTDRYVRRAFFSTTALRNNLAF